MSNPKIKNKSYWLYLHPYVYLNVKKNRGLIYNTLNGKIHEYDCNTEVVRILKRLDLKKKLYVIRLKENELTPNVKKFIHDIRQSFSGDIMDSAFSERKPIQLKPAIGFDISSAELMQPSKIKILKKDKIEKFLSVINIYLNDECEQNCTLCSRAYKQFPYCTSCEPPNKELDIILIKDLMKKATDCFKLNILGGNIFKYSKLGDLIEFLNNAAYEKNYQFSYLNFEGGKDWFKRISKGKENRLHILIHFPVKKEIFSQLMTTLESFDIHQVFHFAIEKEDDITAADDLINEYRIKEFELHPYYTGSNLIFFRKNIFVTKESLMENKPTQRNIFANTTINVLNFRNLTVMSDKSIYANPNHSRIGILGKDHIFDIVTKELKTGRSWGRVRKNVKPCKGCIYNALCPPISNYDYAVGKYNLCHESPIPS